MKNHTVYLTTNKINGLGYIGAHLASNSFDSYLGSGNLILKAVKKYGKENFEKTILGEFNNPHEAHYWEGFYIKLFKTLAHKGGYNISPTGGIKYGGSVSEETKAKIGRAIRGKKAWNRGKKMGYPSEERRKKISESLKGKKFDKKRCENIRKALLKFHENKRNNIENGNI